MEMIELEVYSEQSNSVVVRMKERMFPGTVIQGDSLSILWFEAREIATHLKAMKCESLAQA